MYTTFYDVDGDQVSGRSLYEFAAVLGASRVVTEPNALLAGGVFDPSVLPALYVESTQRSNVQTDLSANPASPTVASLPGIAAFELNDVSAFKALLGARSSQTAAPAITSSSTFVSSSSTTHTPTITCGTTSFSFTTIASTSVPSFSFTTITSTSFPSFSFTTITSTSVPSATTLGATLVATSYCAMWWAAAGHD
ncbi:hypothetical protein AB1Y20_017614 [Prymnesium parvum]|uniref:Uncharacterized protein n=1 Tax=Prymnesium parvum TaxID=97485 RepID=A0AB34JLR7_PRYPA